MADLRSKDTKIGEWIRDEGEDEKEAEISPCRTEL